MRRKDREVKDFEIVKEMIAECDCIRLGFSDGEYPYIVPLNFGYEIEGEQIYFYVHGAIEGRKAELMRKNKKCSFEMDCAHELELMFEHKGVTMRYKCLMGKAEIELLEGEERQQGMNVLMGRMEETREFSYPKNEILHTMVARLKVTEFSGKINAPVKKDKNSAKIKTERLLVEPMDSVELKGLINKYRECVPKLSQAYEEMFQSCKRHPENYLWYTSWKICLRETNEEIGYAGFKGLSEEGSAEIGYGIEEEFQGQGYATEAVRGLCDWALVQSGVKYVEAETEIANEASQRVLKKNGFEATGEMGEEGPRFSVSRENNEMRRSSKDAEGIFSRR